MNKFNYNISLTTILIVVSVLLTGIFVGSIVIMCRNQPPQPVIENLQPDLEKKENFVNITDVGILKESEVNLSLKPNTPKEYAPYANVMIKGIICVEGHEYYVLGGDIKDSIAPKFDDEGRPKKCGDIGSGK